MNSRKFGTKGELTEQLAQVLKALWTCKDASECSTSFKDVVERYGSQFKSSNTQHDAQEFLFWLLDKVHEDLNTASKRKYKNVKNNYGRPDEVIAAETLVNYVRCNNSFVQSVFRAQFRSSLTCPMCHKQSNTFDPFHCVSVQLPQVSFQSINVNVLHDTKTPRQIKMLVQVPQGSSVLSLREKLQQETEMNEKNMILTEVSLTGFGRLFCDSHPASNIEADDTVFCVELPDNIEESQVALCVMNVNVTSSSRFGTLFCMKMNRDVTFSEFQKALLRQMSTVLKPEVFSYSTPISEMFKVHLQEPSADPGTYLEEKFEHPLLTEMIDLALSVQPSDSGHVHIKLSLEWTEPEKYFIDMIDHIVEHESYTNGKHKEAENDVLTLEHCLDHYTKAETLSDENSWRCPQCAKYLPVIKTLGLWSLPDILVIHFKRFRQQQAKASKLTTMVNFPLTDFDLSTWLAGSTTTTEPPSLNSTLTRKSKTKGGSLPRNFANEDQRYDLYAVCYHQGDTLETGKSIKNIKEG
jgi:ubiquitin carboxyl-terminal hydrolase 31